MSNSKKYLLFTITFSLLAFVSYYLGQEKATQENTISIQNYEYQTNSFDEIGDQNELELSKKSEEQLKNIVILPKYLDPIDDVTKRQNKREMCAFKLRSSNKQWVSFINMVNQKCNRQNIDDCWQTQAFENNYNPENIIECFSQS